MEGKTNSQKPEYRVPLMSGIAEIPWNGFNVVSTFSGCGGSSLGYKMAGFKVVWASEFVPAAQETYRANHPGTILDINDIRKVTPESVLNQIGMKSRELDLLDGSPPCSSFSTSGKREESWGKVKKYSDTKQRTDDLFFEFARILQGLQPKTFVAENVSGLVKGKAKGYFKIILKELKSCGYDVKCKVLDAKWLGVPQSRQRTIFVGVRSDLKIDPAHPKPLPYFYSVRDALPWITATGGIRKTGFSGTKTTPSSQPCQTIMAGGGGMNTSQFGVEPEADISKYAIGDEWDNIRPGGKSGKYLSLTKPSLDKPCPTVTQCAGSPSTAGVVHPTEKRKFSIAELKRICGFPDDFKLTGSYSQQWERLGRAVPPVMMSHIAATIRDQILSKT